MAKNKKTKLNTDLDDTLKHTNNEDTDELIEEEDVEIEEVGPNEEDDSAYTMGEINVSEGDEEDSAEEDKKILSQGQSLISNGPEEVEEDVWVEDIDIFDISDPYLDNENYDPESYDPDESY